jgi:predicted DNA binding CopG/RHH family protein
LGCYKTNITGQINVKVLPGYGIVVNGDSVLLGSTKIEDLIKMFNLNTKKSPDQVQWDGINRITGEPAGGIRYETEFSYNGIIFYYSSETDTNNMNLSRISIQDFSNLKVNLFNYDIKKENINIRNLFPVIKDYDRISYDGLSYRLYSYGIDFLLTKKGKNILIKLIDIFPKSSE